MMITVQDIETEFEAQLSKIIDPSIKKKVVETWVEACRQGGWESIHALEKLPFTIATDANGIGLVQHIKASTEGAAALAEIQKKYIPDFPDLDMDIIVAGGLLNDINKVIVFELDESGHYGNKISTSEATNTFPGVAVTRDNGLPDSIVKLVEYECRKGAGGPGNIETIFVQHADFITFDSMDYLNKCKKIP